MVMSSSMMYAKLC